MNKYYIELQNILTDKIRVIIAEMNNNVFELSNENKELQNRQSNKLHKHIYKTIRYKNIK